MEDDPRRCAAELIGTVVLVYGETGTASRSLGNPGEVMLGPWTEPGAW